MKKLLLFFTVLLLISGCSKDETNNNENPDDPTPKIQENVVAILKESAQLTSSETELSNGIYSIDFSGDLPEIIVNDIIVGDEGEGFLRKVTSVAANGNILTMETIQANMEDVFEHATIEFTTDNSELKTNSMLIQEATVNYLADGVTLSENDLEFDFSNTVLYQEGPLTFKITNGTATFDPNLSFKSKYSLFKLSYLDFKVENASLAIDCDVSLNASDGISVPSFSTTLADYDQTIRILVAGIPVKIVINTQLVAELSAGIDSNFGLTAGFTNNATATNGIKYEYGNWSWIEPSNLNSNLTAKPVNTSGEVNITQNLTITPKVSCKFYGIIGPYCQPKMTEDFAMNIGYPSLNMNANLKAGIDITTGIDITIFGKDVPDFSRTHSFEETIWTTEEIGSGWYAGKYTVYNIGDGNSMGDCGSQDGETGDFYIYVGDLSQERQIVVYSKSILSGIPNIYFQPLYNMNDFHNINDPNYRYFGHNYYEDLGQDPNNPEPDGSYNLHRWFGLSGMKLPIYENNVSTVSYGIASLKIPLGTGSPECSDSTSAYAFRYIVRNDSANYVGSNPPSGITSTDLERINTLLEDDSIYVIIDE